MKDRNEVLATVLIIINGVRPPDAPPASANTSLLVDLDLDSLRMLDLVEAIKQEFGVYLLAPPFTLSDVTSATTITDAILLGESRPVAPIED